jgi:hypothetical protein
MSRGQVITTTITFERVTRTARRTGRCPVCDRRVVRQQTFAATISPYNVVADRSRPKTPAEVAAAVQAQADAWEPPPAVFVHDRCWTRWEARSHE